MNKMSKKDIKIIFKKIKNGTYKISSKRKRTKIDCEWETHRNKSQDDDWMSTLGDDSGFITECSHRPAVGLKLDESLSDIRVELRVNFDVLEVFGVEHIQGITH